LTRYGDEQPFPVAGTPYLIFSGSMTSALDFLNIFVLPFPARFV